MRLVFERFFNSAVMSCHVAQVRHPLASSRSPTTRSMPSCIIAEGTANNTSRAILRFLAKVVAVQQARFAFLEVRLNRALVTTASQAHALQLGLVRGHADLF